MAAVCVLYRVGARDEQFPKTGLAHLFEHLMFSNCGSDVDFDEIMQNAGGDSNAFTTSDTTQYYNIAPYQYLEMMLQLESLRMNGFKISQRDFNTQQSVVLEEFSEHYMNNPYGMFSHRLMSLAYQDHPYRWPVIGYEPEHIAGLNLKDAEHFYHQYYHPSNAILVVTGNVTEDELMPLVEKHFGSIAAGKSNENIYPTEQKIQTPRIKHYYEQIPDEAFFIAFHSPSRTDADFYSLDFLTDLLSEGKSSLLYSKMKKENMICSSIDCYLTATTGPGLIILEAKLNESFELMETQQKVLEIIDDLKQNHISDHQWEKYRNKNETAYQFSQLGLVNQALNLSYAEWLGDPELINTELQRYLSLTKEDIQQAAIKYFNYDHAAYMYYHKQD